MNRTIYVALTEPVELRAPVGGRSFFQLENVSGAIIYWDESVIATPENGHSLDDKERIHFSREIGQAVPQGSVWVIGSTVGVQRVLVKEKNA